MKSLITYLFLLLQFEVFSQSPEIKDNPAVQIITDEMIKAFGITSIAEIIILADNWNAVTIDGSSYFFTANNLSAYNRQNVITMIDGQKFEIGIFDVQNLNMLPVSLDQVDYVEFIGTPGIYKGQFVQNGLIHIHTKKPPKGLTLQGTHTIGDETGDPGPLVFTEFKSPNVDKLAQFFSVNINTTGENWFIKSALKHEETFETDPAVDKRISYLNNDDNKTRLISYYFNIGMNLLSGVQEMTASIISNNDYYYFKPYANEIPVKQQIRHFGLKGNSAINNFGINYSAKLSINELGYLDNNSRINFDFGLRNTEIILEAFYTADIFKFLFGIRNDEYTALTSQVLDDKYLSFRNLYAQMDFIPNKNFSQSLSLYNTRNYNGNSFKGSLVSTWFINPGNSITTNFSLISSLFEEDNNYWVWHKRGYHFDYIPESFTVQQKFRPKEIFTADLIYKYKIDSSSSFDAAGSFRSFSNYYLEKQFFQFNTQNSTFSSLTEIVPGEELNVAGASAGFHYKLSGGVSAKINYIYQHPLGGTRLFKELWETFPEHKLMLSLFYHPFPNFELTARLKYFTSTNWNDYNYVFYQSDQLYQMRVEPALLMDLSSSIWLWSRKIWLNASLKNLFNQPEKYHPIGADLDLRMYLQVHFYFNSLLE